MCKIEQNKERKRRAILQAAQDIFLSEGYVLASMDRIAADAQVTKQTVYRYYPSKADLFEATLRHMREGSKESFFTPLEATNTQEALYQFAKGFIRVHLSDQHLAMIRLLVAESPKAPELTRSFCVGGPDETREKLSKFFSERLEIKHVETTVRMWTAMLLAHRSAVLIGMDKPSEKEIEQHARDATDFLLAAISRS